MLLVTKLVKCWEIISIVFWSLGVLSFMGKMRVFENKKGKITYFFFFFLSTFLGTLVVLNLSKIQGQFFNKWVHVAIFVTRLWDWWPQSLSERSRSALDVKNPDSIYGIRHFNCITFFDLHSDFNTPILHNGKLKPRLCSGVCLGLIPQSVLTSQSCPDVWNPKRLWG